MQLWKLILIRKKDDSAIGKLVSVMKPAVDNYADLDDDKRLPARDTMMNLFVHMDL